MKIKYFFLTTLLFFILTYTYGQDKGFEYYELLKAGNSKLTNGVCKIEIAQNIAPFDDYYVVITPIINFSELFVSTKTKEYFEVKSKNTQNGNFDYLVYVKRHKPIPTNKKQPDNK